MTKAERADHILRTRGEPKSPFEFLDIVDKLDPNCILTLSSPGSFIVRFDDESVLEITPDSIRARGARQ